MNFNYEKCLPSDCCFCLSIAGGKFRTPKFKTWTFFFAVCIKFINKFEEKLTDKDRKDNNVVTKKLKKACKKAKGKENRFCYYVGGTEDAATYILNEITKPLAYFMKAEAICEKLKKKDKQICELQYGKQNFIDRANCNANKTTCYRFPDRSL